MFWEAKWFWIFKIEQSPCNTFHFNGVQNGVTSLEMPSLSPLLSIRVLSLVGANLSYLVGLSMFWYLIVLAMWLSVQGALVVSLTLLSNSSLVYNSGLKIHFLSAKSTLDLTPTALSLNNLIYYWVKVLFKTLKFYTNDCKLALNKLLLMESLLGTIWSAPFLLPTNQ